MTLKIYTRTGDSGETSLYDGGRVPKDSLRIECLGVVDELDAAIGVARNFAKDAAIAEALLGIQRKLFVVMAELATEGCAGRAKPAQIAEADVAALERVIDDYLARMDGVAAFILTGTSPAAAFLHVARTVCRRAERRILTLSREAALSEALIKYVNRLSDCLYALARYSEATITYQSGAGKWEA